MNIQGYIRFSYLGRGDTAMSIRHAKDQKAHFKALFDPLRMERRFHLFERLCLPGLRQQTDPDFSVVVVASQVMPQPYKDRLETAVADLPQITVRYSNHPEVLQATRPAVKTFVDRSDSPSLHFRLDDDDALGKDVIARLKHLGARAEPDSILTLPRGYCLFLQDDKPCLVPRYEMFHSVGWTRSNAPGDYRSPFKFGHSRAASRFPTMSDPRIDAYVYAMHLESDTSDRNRKIADKLLSETPQAADPAYQDGLRDAVDTAFPAIGLDGFLTAIQTLPA